MGARLLKRPYSIQDDTPSQPPSRLQFITFLLLLLPDSLSVVCAQVRIHEAAQSQAAAVLVIGRLPDHFRPRAPPAARAVGLLDEVPHSQAIGEKECESTIFFFDRIP